MATRLAETDVVIIGFGLTGAILAEQLTAAGLNVTAIERGKWRDTSTDFPTTYAADELRYGVRLDLFQKPADETVTFRNNVKQMALPIRQFGSFIPGNGVGGANVHWNGQTWRYLPTDFIARSHLEQRYGKTFLPDDMTIQDWGITYDDLEPHYDRFEKLFGIAGKAGNLNGNVQPGGNPFEGTRSSEYPNPPMKQTYGPTLFSQAAANLGFHPFPQPSANMSQAYTNPLGVTLGPCTYCGFCERFGCGNYSKASPQTTILPVLRTRSNLTLRTESEVLKINLDSTGKKATGVLYVDQNGNLIEQPAQLVLVCSFAYHVPRLLLLSGIGTPYDSQSGTGVVGRNYAYQTMSGVRLHFDNQIFNPFIGSGALGMIIDNFNGDNFDHSSLGFVGGSSIGVLLTNGRPITSTDVSNLPPGTPAWGTQWKQAAKDNYLSTISIGAQGSSYSNRGAFLDLDPTYKDKWGQPLIRMTYDFSDNDQKMSRYVVEQMKTIGQSMNPRVMVPTAAASPYSTVPYQTTHNVGGAAMGADPKTSVVNRYLQSWDVSNVFVFGTSVFPQNAGYNPTGTVGALTYWAIDAIKNQYLKNPGPLVQA
jgi:gluconate 2-dehydrogenase alpha chain